MTDQKTFHRHSISFRRQTGCLNCCQLDQERLFMGPTYKQKISHPLLNLPAYIGLPKVVIAHITVSIAKVGGNRQLTEFVFKLVAKVHIYLVYTHMSDQKTFHRHLISLRRQTGCLNCCQLDKETVFLGPTYQQNISTPLAARI